ncbi:uncharacterized protein [Antedon mediterranea]|uniref:uncharacterized protein n=1 Tax=Antedon mediterranea TaxID=105859 RepID=UPI003AF6F2B4
MNPKMRVSNMERVKIYLELSIERNNEVDEWQKGLMTSKKIEIERKKSNYALRAYQQKFEQLKLRIDNQEDVHEGIDEEINILMLLAEALSKKILEVLIKHKDMWKNLFDFMKPVNQDEVKIE